MSELDICGKPGTQGRFCNKKIREEMKEKGVGHASTHNLKGEAGTRPPDRTCRYDAAGQENPEYIQRRAAAARGRARAGTATATAPTTANNASQQEPLFNTSGWTRAEMAIIAEKERARRERKNRQGRRSGLGSGAAAATAPAAQEPGQYAAMQWMSEQSGPSDRYQYGHPLVEAASAPPSLSPQQQQNWRNIVVAEAAANQAAQAVAAPAELAAASILAGMKPGRQPGGQQGGKHTKRHRRKRHRRKKHRRKRRKTRKRWPKGGIPCEGRKCSEKNPCPISLCGICNPETRHCTKPGWFPPPTPTPPLSAPPVNVVVAEQVDIQTLLDAAAAAAEAVQQQQQKIKKINSKMKHKLKLQKLKESNPALYNKIMKNKPKPPKPNWSFKKTATYKKYHPPTGKKSKRRKRKRRTRRRKR